MVSQRHRSGRKHPLGVQRGESFRPLGRLPASRLALAGILALVLATGLFWTQSARAAASKETPVEVACVVARGAVRTFDAETMRPLPNGKWLQAADLPGPGETVWKQSNNKILIEKDGHRFLVVPSAFVLGSAKRLAFRDSASTNEAGYGSAGGGGNPCK